jgi:hypothetical protein
MLDAQDWSTLPAHSAFAVRRMSEMGARSEAADAEDAEGFAAAAVAEPSEPDVAVADMLALLQEEAENEQHWQQGGEAAPALVDPSAAPVLPVAATDEQQWADEELIRAAEAWLAQQQQQQ